MTRAPRPFFEDAALTASLRHQHAQAWERAVGHRFVRELHAGTVPDEVMARYLVQDHRFLDAFLQLIGAALATARTPAARLRFARFAGEVAGDENTYFLRALDALGVSEEQRAQIPNTAPTDGFLDVFREAAETRDHAAILAVLLVTEWLYLDWATRAPAPLPESFVHAEWISLHDGPGFRDLVDFLRAELDAAEIEDPERVRSFFARTVRLENDFFDAAYETAPEGASA
ncbi:TenA family protein [Brachybacterium kimchii]|uniref:Aminopyrimidine aminohydrolase n=1 Tax=Brachybacterium kimchii TaxID=2942909 RepID=A0ABY4N3M0_9MICO|nr:TenA family protein [Brachybacterium kimchii]UQN29166.1 TenA family protein [Brachybacterium kimchii]